MFGFEGTRKTCILRKKRSFFYDCEAIIFLDSSMVEHSAVNRVVVGSSPTRGVLPLRIFPRDFLIELMESWGTFQKCTLLE